MNWHRYFVDLATTVASKSKDPSTKVGCVLVNKDKEVLSVGYNGFPRGVQDTEERLNNRELKYPLVVHAEANAICIAAKNGARLDGASAYITHPPCRECAKLLDQAGIKAVYWERIVDPAMAERWVKSMEEAVAIFIEAGIIYGPVSKENV